MDSEALIAAVRAGDIEAAQALLPVDPIVKRAREICGRHFGDPARFLRGECDDGPHMGAVMQAICSAPLPPPTGDQLTLMARAACYTFATHDARLGGGRWMTANFLTGACDGSLVVVSVKDAMLAALIGNPPVVPAMSA